MAEVKWIKITTDMFNNSKIRHLRRLPEGNSVVLIWVMLLTMAGRCNAGGMVFLTENIPYTAKMLADELDFEENTVQLAIGALERLGMVRTDEAGFLAIEGWEEHQNIEGMERIREQNRLRKQKQREKEKLLLGDGHVTVTGSHATDIDKEEEKKKKKKEKKIIDYQLYADMFNEICVSLPKIRSLSDGRKTTIRSRLEKYSHDEFKQLFEMAEASDFLTGKNESGWTATFDWLLKEGNMVKVLEGNYANKAKPVKQPEKKTTANDDFMAQLQSMYNRE